MQLTRTSFLFLIFGYLGFIGIASFYLTSTIPSSASAIQNLINSANFERVSFHNLRDISTNILLYMPLGFLIAMYRATFKKVTLLTPLILLGFAVSCSVEIIQAFIARTSDIVDVITNTTGYILGYVIAWAAVSIFNLQPQVILGLSSDENSGRIEQSLSAIRFIYIAIATITNLLPLNITVSLSDIFAKTQSVGENIPRLIIDPLFHLQQASIDFQYLTLHALSFLPLAFLSSLILYQRNIRNPFTPALHCLLFAMFLAMANVFIKSGRTDIALPVLAFFVGLIVTLITNRVINLSSAEKQTESVSTLTNNSALITAIIIYLFLILIFSLSPYEFELTLNSIRTKLYESNFIPLRAHLSHRSLGAAIDLVREPLIYAPWGALLYILIGRFLPKTQSIVVAIGLTGATALFIETIQLAIVGRFVDITDPLLAGGGCVLGIMFTDYVLKPLYEQRAKEAAVK